MGKTRKEPNFTQLDGYVTTGFLCGMFSRSELAITNWRLYKGLPYVRIPGDGRDTIRYTLDEVLDWAKDQNIDYSFKSTRERLDDDT